MKNIIIFDTQDLTRIGTEALLHEIDGDINLIRAVTKTQFLDELERNPDAYVVIDYVESGFSDSEALVDLSVKYPHSHWLILSDEISEAMARRLSSFPVFGMALKSNRRGELVSALTSLLNGERHLCQFIMNLLLSPTSSVSHSPVDVLTPTEIEILRQTALGKKVKEIASERFLSVHTVTAHKRSIFRKLHVNTSYEATRVAIKAGLIDVIEYYI